MHRWHPQLEADATHRDGGTAKAVAETRLEKTLQATGTREIDCGRRHHHCENKQQRDEHITP